jgi:hypothetical protein
MSIHLTGDTGIANILRAMAFIHGMAYVDDYVQWVSILL